MGRGRNFRFTPNFYATVKETNNKTLQDNNSAKANCPNISGSLCLNFFKLVRISPASVLTQKLWENSSDLQLDRMNDCFYAVMTIFTQQFYICSYDTRLATVSHGYVVLLLLGRSQTRRQLMLATKRLSPLAPNFCCAVSKLFGNNLV